MADLPLLEQHAKQSYVAAMAAARDEERPVISIYGAAGQRFMAAAKSDLASAQATRIDPGNRQAPAQEAGSKAIHVQRHLNLIGSPAADDFADHTVQMTNYMDGVNEEIAKLVGDDAPEWRCTPEYFEGKGTRVYTGEPVQDLIGADKWSSSGKNRPSHPLFVRGDVIELEDGAYPHFRVTLSTDSKHGGTVTGPEDIEFGKDPVTTIRARNSRKAFISANPVGGSHTIYVEWGGAFAFQGLVFIADDTATNMFENPSSQRWDWHPGFRDIFFDDCEFRGSWNAHTSTGEKEKWGILGYETGVSALGEYGYIFKNGVISGIRTEHACYKHSPLGGILFENVDVKWCGRTAVQIACRIGEGPAGAGMWTFRDMRVEDVCLQSGGGGSAFSFNGRNSAKITLDRVQVRLGCNPDLHSDWSDNITGALVVHAGGDTDDLPNGDVVVRDCDFEVGSVFPGKGSARRANIQVHECTNFSLIGSRVVQGPEAREALDLWPDKVLGKITLDRRNQVIGDCLINNGPKMTYDQLIAEAERNPKFEVIN